MEPHVGMFFGRIYQRTGRVFQPSWRSFAIYAAIVALILLAIEFGVLNILPGNKMGNVLVIVPAFYFLMSVGFILNDAIILSWRWFKSRRAPPRKRARAPSSTKRKAG